MPADQILPLVGLIIVMTGTPGPNNLMLMTSGARFGFRRSIPHILGIVAGCQTLLLGIALGLGSLLQTWPIAERALQLLCIGALLYLTWLLLRPSAPHENALHDEVPEGTPAAHPLTFWQAALFQWVNPKAWMMMVTALAAYSQPDNVTGSIAVIAGLFLVLSLPVIGFWNLSGAALHNWLANPARERWFNRLMAVLLLTSLYPILQ
ncbi:MAG: LysE family translocator [Pseudohongiellaceae bacterium]